MIVNVGGSIDSCVTVINRKCWASKDFDLPGIYIIQYIYFITTFSDQSSDVTI